MFWGNVFERVVQGGGDFLWGVSAVVGAVRGKKVRMTRVVLLEPSWLFYVMVEGDDREALDRVVIETVDGK
ncbi:hypothetical protein [Bartonella heixiaziensis]|uniref:hypothetical protein n=1 Tax=Bartonella heixiaziensis TaxID=1461000 RepID=UPI003D1DA0F2